MSGEGVTGIDGDDDGDLLSDALGVAVALTDGEAVRLLGRNVALVL